MEGHPGPSPVQLGLAAAAAGVAWKAVEFTDVAFKVAEDVMVAGGASVEVVFEAAAVQGSLAVEEVRALCGWVLRVAAMGAGLFALWSCASRRCPTVGELGAKG